MKLTTTGLTLLLPLYVTKPALGDVAVFSNAGATPKSLYVYTDTAYAAIATGANASGENIAFNVSTHETTFAINSAVISTLSASKYTNVAHNAVFGEILGYGNVNTAVGLYALHNALSGASQYGFASEPTVTSAATARAVAASLQVTTAAAAFTANQVTGLMIWDAVKGVGSTITTQYGILIDDQTKGVDNYAIKTGLGTVYFADNTQVIRGSGASLLTVGSGSVSGNHRVDVVGGGVGQDFGYYVSGKPILNTNTSSGTILKIGSNGTDTTFQQLTFYANGIPYASLVPSAFTTLPILCMQSGGFTQGANAARLGADVGANTITNNTRKYGLQTVPHYANATGDLALIAGDSDSATNTIQIGGSLGAFTCATAINFWATANNTTVTGTNVAQFNINGLDVVGRITSTANCALAGTPYAWGFGQVVDVGTTFAVISDISTGGLVVANAYHNGTNWIAKTTNSSSYLVMTGESHVWYSAASVSAGAAASPIEYMRLDSSSGLQLQNVLSTTGDITETTNINSGSLIKIVNNSSGTSAQVIFSAESNSAVVTRMGQFSSGFTTSGIIQPDEGYIYHSGSAPMLYVTAGGDHKWSVDTFGSAIMSLSSAGLNIAGALTISSATMIKTNTAFTNGAGAAAGTLLNAPAAGNPTKWVPFDDNGTIRHFPAW
jgi:hypothetical protein